MFRITHIATGTVLNDECHSEKEARSLATADKRKRLETSQRGQYTLQCLKYKLPWNLVEKDYTIVEMIGVWIDSDEGRLMPDVTTEENELVFIDHKGIRHLGLFDAEEGVYISDDGSPFIPERIVEFMFLPESVHEA